MHQGRARVVDAIEEITFLGKRLRRQDSKLACAGQVLAGTTMLGFSRDRVVCAAHCSCPVE